MKKNKIALLAFLLIAIALVAAGTLRRSAGDTFNNDCSCKETLDEPTPAGQDKLGWENLSHQFFSSF